MPTRNKPAATSDTTAPVFDISRFREAKNYVWREIERDEQSPLRVKLQDLSIRQTNEIPWGIKVPLKDSMEVCAQYVVEWDLEAEDITTGQMVPVPPPAEAGWEVFELVQNQVASDIINWLKIPHYMKAQEEKKSSTLSSSTSEPPSTKS